MIKISAIVPAFNELATIQHVLKTLKSVSKIDEVICVDDGSTDGTFEAASQVPGVLVYRMPENVGKGGALAKGIELAKGQILILIDADLAGLKTHHILRMLKPMVDKRSADAVVAYEKGKFASLFSGQRVYRKKDLMPLLDEIRFSGYEVELILNNNFKDSLVKYIQINGLGHIEKYKKQVKSGWFQAFIAQWGEILLKQLFTYGISKKERESIRDETLAYIKRSLKEIAEKGKLDKFTKKQ